MTTQKIRLTLETPSGDLYRDFAYDQSPDEVMWGEVIPDMIDTIEKSTESIDERNSDHNRDNQV